MDAQSIVTYKSTFDSIMHEILADDGSTMEVWYARELQSVCGYTRWENFATAINRAKESCKSQNIGVDDHFRDVTKTIPMPKGAQKEIDDVLLTRYACYLIAQNGDPKKEEIAFAQSYFAVQTRRAELIAERLQLQQRLEKREELRASEKRLSQNIYERGIKPEELPAAEDIKKVERRVAKEEKALGESQKLPKKK